jgi:hypothetical protein
MNPIPLILFAGLILWGSSYVYIHSSLLHKSSPSSTPAIVSTSPSPKALGVVPVVTNTPESTQMNWTNTYTDRGYGVKFLYPPTFSSVNSSTITPSSYIVPATAITLKGSSSIQASIVLSKLADYKGTVASSAADQLRQAYESRGTTSLLSTLLPPSSLGLVVASNPSYIQSSDGTFRGVSLYGYLGQNAPAAQNGRITLTTAIVVVTNGQVIWQLTASDQDAQTDLQDLSNCKSNNGTVQCSVSSKLQQEMTQIYLPMAASLTAP